MTTPFRRDQIAATLAAQQRRHALDDAKTHTRRAASAALAACDGSSRDAVLLDAERQLQLVLAELEQLQ